MMQDSLIDFVADNQLAGFRLHKLQIYNWGTFNGKVWALELNGRNTLLTGDIGSGKSTLVDAITTLLVPANKVSYNKAAGAVAKERSLRSYVMGYYRATKSELGTKQEGLRSHNDYSVILGTFYNEGFDQWVTLAQVFWLKDGQNTPAKFYVVAEKQLNIVQDFANFGADIKDLRKQLRQQEFLEVFDNYKPYASIFRRKFGIKNEQALELFHQTVSMKQVGNLTEFVREHMLENSSSAERVDNLIHHFNDLDGAYQLVLKSKQQITLLQPLIVDAKRFSNLETKKERWQQLRGALVGFFSSQKSLLLKKRQVKLTGQMLQAEQKIASLQQLKTKQDNERDDLKQDILEQGGDRLNRLQQQINDATVKKQQCQSKNQDYSRLLQELELLAVTNQDDFNQRSAQISQLLIDLETRETEIADLLSELEFTSREHKIKLKKLYEELTSLKTRKNNIDGKQILIRQELCKAIQVAEDELPFIGELLQVRAEQVKWEGAIERILHNFALSLLVPVDLYDKVFAWVEKTKLKGRLVYYRIPQQIKSNADLQVFRNSLVHKLAIKSESQFSDWLQGQLSKRFNYACCENITDFKREKQAVTLQGQVKSANNRHEKDDRRDINDRRFFVLGWSNKQKIAKLEQEITIFRQEINQQQQVISKNKQQQKQLKQHRDITIKLTTFKDFTELNWSYWVQQIATWQQEKRQIEHNNNQLKVLQEQLISLEVARKKSSTELSEQEKQQGGLASELKTCVLDITETKQLLDVEQENDAFNDDLAVLLTEYQQKWQFSPAIQVEHIAGKEKIMRDKIQTEINNNDQKIARLRDKINKQIIDFSNQYKAETIEFLGDIQGLTDYKKLLKQLQKDDLPKFERKFKEQLNKNTINQISSFNINLKKQQKLIAERIAQINLSLAKIDYNPNRYIRLELAVNPDVEIKGFYQELNACLDGTLTDSAESYSEAKFLQVKQLIDKFKGRDGLLDLDRKWTAKVTDVRNFFLFSASERWRADDVEHEHYSDSSGKSGGQKEKLAYTVLAASLSYQFGLEFGEIKSRSFRFVVIDEAFGRGSDESAHYGLELFKHLNLQLLVVTPKQKIHVIEPFVAHVGFVNSLEGKESQLRTLSIEEHLAEKAKQQKLQAKIKTQRPA